MTEATASAADRAIEDPGRAHEELVRHLQALIRLRTVNPPGDETIAARYLADVLGDAGIPVEVREAAARPTDLFAAAPPDPARRGVVPSRASVASPAGLEPATRGLEDRCSVH